MDAKKWSLSRLNIAISPVNFPNPGLSLRRLARWYGGVALVGAMVMSISAQTYVNRVGAGGAVQNVTLPNTVWPLSGSPYIVEGQVTVADGAVLTVESGVVVQVNSGRGLFVNGTLHATQTTFTVNGSGNWLGIYLSSAAGGSVLDGCTIRSAGADNFGYIHSGYRRASIYVDGCAPTIVNCTIADSAAHGIECWPNGGTIRGNVFQNIADGWYAMVLDGVNNSPAVSGNTATGTGIPGIYLPSGTISGTNQWNNPGSSLAYYFSSEIAIAEGAQLIIDPGVTAKVSGGRLTIYGTVSASGTEAAPILFTSSNTSANPADWFGFYLGPKAGDSVFNYVTLAYAGRDNLGYIHSAYRSTTVYLDGCSPRFDHLTIRNSRYNGIEMFAANPVISNARIENCGGHGLKAESGSRPSVSNTAFVGNGRNGVYTIGTDASSVPVPVNVSFVTNQMQGVQIWGGTLDKDAQWKNWSTNAPYVVTDNVTVNQDVTLTIEPGTTIKWQSVGFYVNGTVIANGDPGLITFTSWRDDTVGGDTNGDGQNTLPDKRNWKGIYLSPASGASVFSHCEFRYSGGDNLLYIHSGYRLTTLYVDGSAVTITNCAIVNSGGHGIELWDSAGTLRNNRFQDMFDGYYAVVYDALDTFPLISGNTASGTGYPGVYVTSGTVNGTNHWNNPGTNFCYYQNQGLSVAVGALLVLDPGVVIKTANGWFSVAGTLDAQGTAAQPIIFTSRNDSPQAGDWYGIYLGSQAGGSVFSYLTIAYAGKDNLGYFHSAYRATALYLDSCSPQFDHLSISNSQWNGLELYSASPPIKNLTVLNCGGHGLKAEAESRPAVLTGHFAGNGYNGNGYYTVGTDASSVPNPSNVTFETNRLQGIQIWGGSLGQDAQWKNWSSRAPYIITADVSQSANTTLNIEAGTTIKFRGTAIYLNGVVTADGALGRIAFTSSQDDTVGGDTNGDGTNTVAQAGDWRGIYLSPGSGASLFNNCAIRYAGGNNLGYLHSGYRYVSMYVDSCSPTITNCSITDSAGHGLEFWSSAAIVRNTEFLNFASSGYALVQDTLDTNLKLSTNTVAGTGNAGISIPGGSLLASVIWQNPGAGFTFFLDGEVSVPEDVTLTIEPGVTMATARQRLLVYGTLDARGTQVQPITFTSRNAAPAPGDWTGIYFGEHAGMSALNYVTIDYAGRDNLGYIHSAYRYTAVFVDSCSPVFDHVTISNSRSQGLQLWGSNATIRNSAIKLCGGYGMIAQTGSRPTLTEVNFAGNGNNDNGYSTVGMDASCVPMPANVTFTTNRLQSIRIWGGALDQDGLWRNWATNAPYWITEDATINSGVHLTIESGTTIKLQQRGLYVNGTVTALGDPAPITFTSWQDDSMGGDSNGDGTNTVAHPSDWKGIYLSPASGDSKLENCTVRYAGGENLGYINSAYRRTALYIDQCSPTITNNVVADSGVHGIELYASAARIQGNGFMDLGNSAYAVVYDTLDCYPLMHDNMASGTGWGGIAIPGGTMGSSGSWTKPGTNFPYYLNGDLTIADGQALRIEPGAEVQSSGPGMFTSGTLVALGTVTDPIVFTSRNASPAPGDWKGIYFGPNAGRSILQFCTVANAGADNLGYFNSGYRRTALYVDSSSPRFANLTVSRSAVHAIMLSGSGAGISSSLILSNATSGIVMFNGGNPQIINNTIVGNQGPGIYVYAGTPNLANNIMAYNQTAGLKVDGGSPELIKNCAFGNTPADYVGVAQGNNNYSFDPQFMGLNEANYRLAAGSLAIDDGDDSALQPTWMDLDAHVRRNGASVDLGAYEYGAAPAQHAPDALVRNSGDANYVGDGIYDLLSQTKSQTVLANTPAVYQVKVKYDGNIQDNLNILGTGNSPGWTVKYYDSLTGTNDITAKVTSLVGWNGGLTNVTPGTAIEFRVEVTPDKTVTGNATKEVVMTTLSGNEPTRRDTVRMVTSNAPVAFVDMQIRRAEDILYAGEGVINNSGLNQTKIREVDQGETAVYQIQVSNGGNLTDTLQIQGPGSGGGWDVRYYDSLNGTNDITAWVTGQGWTNITLRLGASYEFRVEVTGNSQVAGGAINNLLITGISASDRNKSDTVKAETLMAVPSATPQGGTYTVDADFDKGIAAGVEFQTVHDQLQLAKESVTLPFIWVPNSNEGTVSKIDTRTGRELGRYRTGPAGQNSQPSRTTVDQQGNCWLANRQSGSVVKIGLYENGQYTDRNGNGMIETSQDKNGDGIISGDELLPWGQDECVLYEVVVIPGKEGTFVPGTYTGTYVNDYWNPGPRGIAVDAKGNVWIGTYATRTFYYLDGNNAVILRTNDVSSVNHTSYGALIDRQGILWSSGNDKNHVLRLNPADNTFSVIEVGHLVYGLGLDQNNHLYASAAGQRRITRINVLTGEKQLIASYYGRGICTTEDGDFWTPDSDAGTVQRFTSDGVLKVTIPVGPDPTGVSVDSAGKVWVTMNGNGFIKRIDPATQMVDLSKELPGTVHYSYSDMTGIISRTATTQFGRWTVIHNAKVKDTPWGTLAWHSSEPSGTSIKVRARSSNDLRNWSLWENAKNGMTLNATPPGKYLQVEVTMQVLSGNISPILYDLTVTPAGGANLGQLIYSNNFQSVPGAEWSGTNLTTTPNGARQFLGPVANTNLTLTLSNVPPHVAVSITCDLLVLGSWDGNNTNDGPDLFELNVAGGLKLLHTTFNNGPTNSIADGQAYPDSFPEVVHPAHAGAAETNTLGYAMDSVYPLSFTFPHTANMLVLNFAAFGLNTHANDESWGLNNVRVYITAAASAPSLIALGKTTDNLFKCRLLGEPQQSYTFEASTNLVDWTEVGNVTLDTNWLDWVDQDSLNHRYRYYRALRK